MNYRLSTPTTEELANESAVDLLADRRRRTALRVLAEFDTAASLADVATLVAARETDADVREVPADAVRDARVRLHHVHFPKLAEVGVISYDHEKRIADPVRIDAVEPVLESIDEWSG